MKSFTVAAAQSAPVFLDLGATIEKACTLIAEAGKRGARLIVFPEAFVPAYPEWIWVIPPRENKLITALYAELVEQSMIIPGNETAKLCRAAKRAKIHVVMGINERASEGSGTSLYNSLLYIDEKGTILGKHRKLVPTAPERMIWAGGDGSTLDVYDTPFGKLGGLICWENYMPLARYAMYAWGTQIYVAATWDYGEPWLSTLRHIAKEGRLFVIGCSMAMRLRDIPDTYEHKRFYPAQTDWINSGESAIVNPDGKFLAGPVSRKDEILYAEIDPQLLTGPRWKLDVAGHYGRPDVFHLTVNKEPYRFIRKSGEADEKKG